MKKRILAIVLCLMMVLTMGNFAFAGNDSMVGKTGTAKVGTLVYVEMDETSESNPLSSWQASAEGTHEITVKGVHTSDDGTVWFEYEIYGLNISNRFPYIKASDVDFGGSEPETPEQPKVDSFGIPVCNCDTDVTESLDSHDSDCARKAYIDTYVSEKTAEDIMANWHQMDSVTQAAIKEALAKDEDKNSALNELISASEKKSQTVNGKTFKTSEAVYAGETKTEKIDAISEAAPFVNTESQYHYYDIKSTTADSAEVTVSGIASDNEYKHVIVLHLLDEAQAILDAQNNGMGVKSFTVDNQTEFVDEIIAAKEATGEDNKVYYTYQKAELKKNGDVTFVTDSFSTFIFVVNFEYEGEMYSMSGGGEVQLSEIMVQLNLKYDIADVKKVEFSDDELISIEEKDGDWTLTSLASFTTQEFLTIKFNDGKTIEVLVTDPVIYYYLPGTDWNLGTKTEAITKSGASTSIGNKLVNKTVITEADVIANADTDADIDIVVYARPGSAVGFQAGTTWPDGSWKLADSNSGKYKHDKWEWIWDGSINYALLSSNITEVTETTFDLTETINGKACICKVKIVIVPERTPTKLSEKEETKDMIKTLPVTLYNYDGTKFNQKYDSASDRPYLAFTSVVKGVSVERDCWTSPSSGNVNSGGGAALMGILENNLVNGLPVMKAGQKVDLFSTTEFDGKEVYENVGFEFVYNKDTGYYTYSSNMNHAQFNGTDKIELYYESLAPSHTSTGSTSHGNGGFYPFNDINKAFLNKDGISGSDTSWDADFEQKTGTYAMGPVDSNSKSPASTTELHFGIQMDVDFYLPKDKKSDFGEDIVYKFTGDDDLWVFIDNELVLDIGGGHTAVSGSIDFTNGIVTVDKYTELEFDDNDNCTVKGEIAQEGYTKKFSFEADAMHNMKVFYLERHAGVSNCRMHFNIPIIPSESVLVTKNVVDHEGESLTVTPDVDYTFKLYKRNVENDDQTDNEFAPYRGKEYTSKGNVLTTAEDGTFTLKAGETAVFEDVPRFTELYAVEVDPNNGYVYTESKVSVNDAAATKYEFGNPTASETIELNKSVTFGFTNYMQSEPLTIKKEVVGGASGLIDANQKFSFDILFNKDCVIDDKIETSGAVDTLDVDNKNKLVSAKDVRLGGTFELKQGQQITFPRVPVNMTYKLTERNPDENNNSFVNPDFTAITGAAVTSTEEYEFNVPYEWKVVADSENDNNVVVTNQQLFDLTITKEGIADVDHDSLSPVKEEQATLYSVTGPNEYSTIVAIKGNNSVTIKDLPVGKYVVEEVDDWSWRYTISEINDQNVGESTINVVPAQVDEIAKFTNVRSNLYWLNGGTHNQNLFN